MKAEAIFSVSFDVFPTHAGLLRRTIEPALWIPSWKS